MLDAALAYAARGWAIFPCQPKNKQPLTAHGFKDATTDVEQITRWWTEYPDANIAIATGAVSHINVLDVDIKPWKDAHGDQSLIALLAEHGALPSTLYQRTWSGGLHYLFAYATGVRNSTSKVGPHLDIRGDGGYIVVAPSHVEEDGHEGVYRWQNDVAPAPMPDWLLERSKTAGTKKAKNSHGSNNNGNNPPGWTDAHINGTPDGSRDDTCLKLIGRYSQMRPPLTRAEVTQFLLQWAEKSLDDQTPPQPFPAEIVLEKIERLSNAMAYGLVDLPLTDAGNAERLVLLHGDRFRWAVDRKTWLAWDGRRWAPGSDDRVRALALAAIRQTQAAAVRLDADAHRPGNTKKRIARHAVESEDRRGIDNAVALAKILDGVAIKDDVLDTRPMLLNVQNGTVDLATGALRAHDPADFLTQLVDVPYDPESKAPTWEAFLNEVFMGKACVIEYVQRAIGYSVTGSTVEQCLFYEHGGGDNGKSTFIEAIGGVVGEDYMIPVDKEAVLHSDKNKGRGAAPEMIQLRGKRLGYISENNDDRMLDEGRVKMLTGSEKSNPRDLYKGNVALKNTVKLWFDLNALPRFTGVDEGISRRQRVIPFDWRVPPEKKDRKLPSKLRAEAPGILAWIVAGAVAWNQQGLVAPPEVEYATREYVDEQNHLPAFVEEHYMIVPSGEGMVASAALQQDYAGFCHARGEMPLDYQRKVVKYLRDVLKLKLIKTKHGNVWTGITPRRS
jgi:putative DNA primase/helicase